jgi:hypothetical protein
MAENRFQSAVEEIHEIVGPQYVRIFSGSGGPLDDCGKGREADQPLTIRVRGFEDVPGDNLADALAKFKAQVGRTATAVVAAPAPARKSKK